MLSLTTFVITNFRQSPGLPAFHRRKYGEVLVDICNPTLFRFFICFSHSKGYLYPRFKNILKIEYFYIE